MFSKYRLSNLEVLVGEYKIKTIIAYIKAGYTRLDEIADRFDITEKQAWMIYMMCHGFEFESSHILGSKIEQYFDGDEPIIGPYKLEELTGDELEIANRLPESPKFSNMGKMKEIFMEVYENHEGDIPEGYTLRDYLAEVNENRRLQELKALEEHDKRENSPQAPSKEENPESD